MPGTEGKMTIVFEQFVSELPATQVTKETRRVFMLDSIVYLIKGSMSVLLERLIFLALNFNLKFLTC